MGGGRGSWLQSCQRRGAYRVEAQEQDGAVGSATASWWEPNEKLPPGASTWEPHWAAQKSR